MTADAVTADPSDARPFGRTAYVAPEGFVDDLLTELGPGCEVHGRLVFAPGPVRSVAWAHAAWIDPVLIPIASIKDGARRLKAIQRNWHLHPIGHFRRAELIAGQLPHVSAKPLVFPGAPPTAPLGAWTLLEPDLILAAAQTTSPFPDGEPRFVEDREAPPNRAYLKLWEAFTHIGARPGPGDRCLDLGASPGGWTWVLATLGAAVTAIDKAPLDPRIAAMTGVTSRQESAFGLDPRAFDRVDWLCSDVICYPARLLTLVRRWLDADAARNFVCTLKFQAETDHATAAAFAAIPGSRLLHLANNKHELTWTLVR